MIIWMLYKTNEKYYGHACTHPVHEDVYQSIRIPIMLDRYTNTNLLSILGAGRSFQNRWLVQFHDTEKRIRKLLEQTRRCVYR